MSRWRRDARDMFVGVAQNQLSKEKDFLSYLLRDYVRKKSGQIDASRNTILKAYGKIELVITRSKPHVGRNRQFRFAIQVNGIVRS